MKGIGKFVVAAILLLAPTVYAGEAELVYDTNTGDKQFDLKLGNLNVEASGDIGNFISDLSLYYQVQKQKLERLINIDKMSPADLYMVVKIGQVSNEPIDKVVREYRKEREDGELLRGV